MYTLRKLAAHNFSSEWKVKSLRALLACNKHRFRNKKQIEKYRVTFHVVGEIEKKYRRVLVLDKIPNYCL